MSAPSKEDQVKRLDAQARAAGLTDNDRHEVLKFLSMLQERSFRAQRATVQGPSKDDDE